MQLLYDILYQSNPYIIFHPYHSSYSCDSSPFGKNLFPAFATGFWKAIFSKCSGARWSAKERPLRAKFGTQNGDLTNKSWKFSQQKWRFNLIQPTKSWELEHRWGFNQQLGFKQELLLKFSGFHGNSNSLLHKAERKMQPRPGVHLLIKGGQRSNCFSQPLIQFWKFQVANKNHKKISSWTTTEIHWFN